MVQYFSELDLSFTIITETWFYNSEALDVVRRNLEKGHGISSINFYRKKKSRSNPGGGVTVAFRKAHVTFKEFTITRKNYEILGVRGKITNNTRPIFIIATYISIVQNFRR